MDFASAPDPSTVVIHWKQIYVKADEGDHLIAVQGQHLTTVRGGEQVKGGGR